MTMPQDTAPHAALDAFCTLARQTLQQQALPAALPRLTEAVARLIQDPDFVAAHFNDALPAGKRVLHADAATGFRVLAHVQGAGHGSAPHDHGSSWAVYGTVRGRTDMVEYRRVDDGSAAAVLQPLAPYSLLAGQARAYPPGTIHATAHPDNAWVLRVTGANLDELPRFRLRKAHDTVLPAAA